MKKLVLTSRDLKLGEKKTAKKKRAAVELVFSVGVR